MVLMTGQANSCRATFSVLGGITFAQLRQSLHPLNGIPGIRFNCGLKRKIARIPGAALRSGSLRLGAFLWRAGEVIVLWQVVLALIFHKFNV